MARVKRETPRFNLETAERIIPEITRRYERKIGIFRHLVSPQHLYFPEFLLKDARKFTCFYFFSATGERGGRDSDTRFKWELEVLKRFPELYLPEEVYKLEPKDIFAAIEEVGRSITNGKHLGESPAGALAKNSGHQMRARVENARILHEYYGDDPRNLLYGTTSWTSFINKVLDKADEQVKFLGMRWKIWALFLSWIWEFDDIYPEIGLCPVPKYPIPTPVDIHLLRLFSQWDILDKRWWGKVKDPTRKRFPEFLWEMDYFRRDDWRVVEIMKFTLELIEKKRISPISMVNALWLYSRSLCSRHPQLKMSGDFYDIGAWKAPPSKKELEGNLDKWPKSQADPTKFPCAACVPIVREQCKFLVPSRPHMKFGYVVRYPRAEHPMHRNVDLSDFPIRVRGLSKNGKGGDEVEQLSLKLEECSGD